MNRARLDSIIAGTTSLTMGDRNNLTSEDEQYLRAGLNKNMPFVAGESGVGPLVRAALSFATTEQGKENILKNTFGITPRRTPTGELGVVKDGKIYAVDDPAFEWSDIADFAGDVLPAVGGFVGTVAGTPATLPGAMLGGAAGSAAGAAAKGLVAQELLESGEDYSGSDIATEAAFGAGGELLARPLSYIAKKAAAPFFPTSETVSAAKELGESVPLKPKPGMGGPVDVKQLHERLPLSARVKSPSVHQAEAYAQQSPLTSDLMKEKVSDPLQAGFAETFENIAGISPDVGRSEMGTSVMEAATKTLRHREKVVNELYDQLEKAIPPDAPVQALNSADTLINIQDITGSHLGAPEFAITKQLRDELASLEADVLKIETFRDLNVFRKAVGAMIKSPGKMEQFAQSGMDQHVRRLYGGILADVEGVAAEFGQEALEGQARKGAKEIFDIDRSSVRGLFKDPLKAAQFADNLFNKRQTVEFVKMAKSKMGAVKTAEAGLPSTAEGETAWDLVGDVLMQRIRQESIFTDTGLMSGPKLLAALEKFGGRDILGEAFGKETTEHLYQLGRLMKDANIAERFLNPSRTGVREEVRGLLDLSGSGGIASSALSKLSQVAATRGLGRALTNPGSRGWVSEGYLQGPTAQMLLNTVPRAVSQPGVRSGADWLEGGR